MNMKDTISGCFFVQSIRRCHHKECKEAVVVMDSLSGRGYCSKHAPILWLEMADVNWSRYYDGNAGHMEIQEADEMR